MLNGRNSPHNAHGIGSRVYVKIGDQEQMRELNASSGYNGHGPNRIAHFGLGTAEQVDSVRAVWTNGDVTEFRAVAANQSITLDSPHASISSRTTAPGESVSVDYPQQELPEGATASWRINGADYGPQATVQLTNPGQYRLTITISTGETDKVILWTESLQVTVEETVVDHRSVAQIWNEQNLDAIRIDFPDPTKHARNLFASSVAMWDAWAAFDATATGVLHNEQSSINDTALARREAISYAAYRVLRNRYSDGVNGSITLSLLDQQMDALGYSTNVTTVTGDTPAAIGNRVAEAVLAYMDSDGWTDYSGFMGGEYSAVNAPLEVFAGGTTMAEPNRWQPLEFEEAFTQNQQTTDLIQEFLGPHWGAVRPFALSTLGENEWLHLDPGPPPLLGTDTEAAFKSGSATVIEFSSFLDPADGQFIDISPDAIGNNTLGLNDGTGHPLNPATGEPYPPNIVRHADFGRVLAEFWADGPDSETPPGHWNTLANELHEHPSFERRYLGTGPELDRLEWDVKLYLALNGALHDAAVAAWGCKRVYDYVRPISSIRYMGGLGQSSDVSGPSFHPQGLPLIDDLIELVTEASAAPGQRHAHLSEHIGKVAIYAWSAGEDIIPGGVDWMLAGDWMPYQRATFVTPAFPGYVSGHSTFSRAAAEVLTRMTGSAFFPGGLGTFTAHENEYLEFEEGPTTDIILQWATYYDAADQAGLSRLYGGIHVPADDGPGRIMGSVTGIMAWELAARYFDGSIQMESIHPYMDIQSSTTADLVWNTTRGAHYKIQSTDDLRNPSYVDITEWIQATETESSNSVTIQPGQFFRIQRSHRPE